MLELGEWQCEMKDQGQPEYCMSEDKRAEQWQ